MRGWLERFLNRDAQEADLARELRAHLEAEVEDQLEAGLSHEEAQIAARRALGNDVRIREDTRAVWAWTALEALVQDIHFGIRLLRRNRTFALFSIASLALGIGATSAIFSLFNAIVLRQLPVKRPNQLVAFSFAMPGAEANSWLPYPHFERMRDENHTLEGIFAWNPIPRISVTFQGNTDVASGVYVTGDYHQMLGLKPTLGRLLSEDDDRPGSAPVAVISDVFWRRRFGGSASIVGASIAINQRPFTIIGVEPSGFFGVSVGSASDVSMAMHARDLLSDGEPLWNQAFSTWIGMMGRVREGVSRAEAEQDLNFIFRRVSAEAARSATEQRLAREANLRLDSGETGGVSGLRRGYERWLGLLLVMLGAVLLLASLNVATLLLARSEARRREMATRLALGAGRWRMVRQMLTESALIAGAGGVLGLLLAWWGSRTLLRIAISSVDSLPVDLTPDVRVIAFTLIVAALTCLLFGLLPALRTTSSEGTLSARGVVARKRRLLDRTLVASQVGLSFVLLLVAGLFLRSLQNLWVQDTGYDRNNVLMFSLDAGLAGKRGSEVPSTYQHVLDQLATIPGAHAVSVSSVRPVTDGYYFISSVTSLGGKDLPEDQPIRVAFNNVGPGYFGTLGIPLIAGRDFDRRDHETAPKVAIISEKLARHLSGNPVGQHITLTRRNVVAIVAVAKDIRYASIKDAPREVVYLPMLQSDAKSMWYAPTFEIRYSGALAEVERSVREAVVRVDPALTVLRSKTLEVQTQESLSRERLLAMLATYFAAFSLLLAGIGIYGLLMYTVIQRTPELGLRMALGAQAKGIRRAVMRESSVTVLGGLVLGCVVAGAAARLIRSQLFGLEPTDPAAVIAASSLLLALALCASYLPALRASRIDPMTALRQE